MIYNLSMFIFFYLNEPVLSLIHEQKKTSSTNLGSV